MEPAVPSCARHVVIGFSLALVGSCAHGFSSGPPQKETLGSQGGRCQIETLGGNGYCLHWAVSSGKRRHGFSISVEEMKIDQEAVDGIRTKPDKLDLEPNQSVDFPIAFQRPMPHVGRSIVVTLRAHDSGGVYRDEADCKIEVDPSAPMTKSDGKPASLCDGI
jgi:hypothetical protein